MGREFEAYFGIDFGTTSSAVVGINRLKGTAKIVKYGDEEGLPIPSTVAIDKKTGEVFTGRDAWARQMELSESCEYIYSIKTILDSDTTWQIGGREWNAVDIAAEIFKTLKDNVTGRNNVEFSHATVAIPIGFSPVKRTKLREAAQKAGIIIDTMVSESTAAFFANYHSLKSATNVVVFDWGGGTLDISVLRHEKGRVSELATGGMEKAGDEIDRQIALRMHRKIARTKGKEIAFEDMPPMAQDVMRVRSERAKRDLSDSDTVRFNINKYGEYGVCREILEYDWFRDIVEPFVTAAIDCLQQTIAQSGLGAANIDRILMVGGSSNLRPLQEEIEKIYGDKLYYPEETMWNVGEGAAMLARNPGGYYSNQQVTMLLSDNTPFELLGTDVNLQNWHKEYNFGIVDPDSSARFVFSGSPDIDSSLDKYRSIDLPLYKFLQEKVIVKALVDDNRVFRVLVRSSMRADEFQRVWEYAGLKFYYKLK